MDLYEMSQSRNLSDECEPHRHFGGLHNLKKYCVPVFRIFKTQIIYSLEKWEDLATLTLYSSTITVHWS